VLALHNWRNGVSKVRTTVIKDDHPLRIGVLGAAAINNAAIIDPVSTHTGAVVVAIAARDLSRAQAQVENNRLGPSCKAYGSYAELLADPDIDAVYIPLPNGLHSEWAIKSMLAGKHVLVEKPIASNAAEVRQVEITAMQTNKVVLEAFHWRFHPAAHTMKELIDGGKYGSPVSIFAKLKIPSGALSRDDIRLQYKLAGGSCMDLTYVFSASTYFASSDITKCAVNVLSAKPRLAPLDPKIDAAMETEFVVEEPDKPTVHCSTQSDLRAPWLFGFIPRLWDMSPYLIVELEKAKLEFTNFVLPSYGHFITVTEKDDQGRLLAKKQRTSSYKNGPYWKTRGEIWWTTYRWQLEAFVEAVRAKESGKTYEGPWMSLKESEKVMGLIDAVYEKAGLPLRGI